MRRLPIKNQSTPVSIAAIPSSETTKTISPIKEPKLHKLDSSPSDGTAKLTLSSYKHDILSKIEKRRKRAIKKSTTENESAFGYFFSKNHGIKTEQIVEILSPVKKRMTSKSP